MLKTILVEDFQRCYQNWERLHWYVAAQGKYFERDNIDVKKKIKTLVNKNQSHYFSATPCIYIDGKSDFKEIICNIEFVIS